MTRLFHKPNLLGLTNENEDKTTEFLVNNALILKKKKIEISNKSD